MRTLPRLAILISLVVLPAVSAFGQADPNHERGLPIEKVFQMGDIDNVSVFNGNLALSIPLGPAYQGSGTLQYQFTLTYNSKIWDYKERLIHYEDPPGTIVEDSRVQAIPDRQANAGLGWRFSLGDLLSPGDPANDNGGGWIYVSQDGSQHDFYPTLHTGEAVNAS